MRTSFFVTTIIYSCLFASLLAAGGVVLYKNYTTTQLEKEVVLLDSAINTFSVQDFSRVQEFNNLLNQTSKRVQYTVSTVTMLDELDRIIAQPIRIKDLNIVRNGDEDLLLTVEFTTETLDAALFQRKLLTANTQLFTGIEISSIDLIKSVQDENSDDKELVPTVTFVAKITVPVIAAVFDPSEARRIDAGTGSQTLPVVPNSSSESTESIGSSELLDSIASTTNNETTL